MASSKYGNRPVSDRLPLPRYMPRLKALLIKLSPCLWVLIHKVLSVGGTETVELSTRPSSRRDAVPILKLEARMGLATPD